jgi:hypothetical protein
MEQNEISRKRVSVMAILVGIYGLLKLATLLRWNPFTYFSIYLLMVLKSFNLIYLVLIVVCVLFFLKKKAGWYGLGGVSLVLFVLRVQMIVNEIINPLLRKSFRIIMEHLSIGPNLIYAINFFSTYFEVILSVIIFILLFRPKTMREFNLKIRPIWQSILIMAGVGIAIYALIAVIIFSGMTTK